MLIQTLRVKRGWSQEQLAEFSGLSTRTVQRLEAGNKASVETLKAIAAVFEINYSDLSREQDMSTRTQQTIEEEAAFRHVRKVKRFYLHCMNYVLAIAVIGTANYLITPHRLWFGWMAMGWGCGIVVHGLAVFSPFKLFGPAWEKQQVEKRLGRPL